MKTLLKQKTNSSLEVSNPKQNYLPFTITSIFLVLLIIFAVVAFIYSISSAINKTQTAEADITQQVETTYHTNIAPSAAHALYSGETIQIIVDGKKIELKTILNQDGRTVITPVIESVTIIPNNK